MSRRQYQGVVMGCPGGSAAAAAPLAPAPAWSSDRGSSAPASAVRALRSFQRISLGAPRSGNGSSIVSKSRAATEPGNTAPLGLTRVEGAGALVLEDHVALRRPRPVVHRHRRDRVPVALDLAPRLDLYERERVREPPAVDAAHRAHQLLQPARAVDGQR